MIVGHERLCGLEIKPLEEKQNLNLFLNQVLAETGMGWTTRKVAGMMTVNLEVEAREEGMFTALKTKLKNTDNLLLYNGVTKTKGLSDDEVSFLSLTMTWLPSQG